MFGRTASTIIFFIGGDYIFRKGSVPQLLTREDPFAELKVWETPLNLLKKFLLTPIVKLFKLYVKKHNLTFKNSQKSCWPPRAVFSQPFKIAGPPAVWKTLFLEADFILSVQCWELKVFRRAIVDPGVMVRNCCPLEIPKDVHRPLAGKHWSILLRQWNSRRRGMTFDHQKFVTSKICDM